MVKITLEFPDYAAAATALGMLHGGETKVAATPPVVPDNVVPAPTPMSAPAPATMSAPAVPQRLPETNVVPMQPAPATTAPGVALAPPAADTEGLVKIAISTAKLLGSDVNQAMALLKEYGVAKVSELQAPQLVEFTQRVSAMVEAAKS